MNVAHLPRLRAVLAATAIFGAAACDEPRDARPAQLIGALPPQLCAKAKGSLDKIAATAVFEYDAAGGATIEEAVWIALGKARQDQLAQALAVHRACGAELPAATQEIMIRNEGGRTLAGRIVEIAPGQDAFLAD